MGERLERLRDEVRARLGQLMAGAPPDDGAVDLALADGLVNLGASWPVLEAEVEVVRTGHLQDIGALLPDLQTFVNVVYPYEPGAPQVRREFYQVVDVGKVRFYAVEPAAGEKMLVQYRPRYFLAGLQEGRADTLPEKYETPLAVAACGNLVFMQAMRSHLAGELKGDGYATAMGLVESLIGGAAAAAASISDRYANPAWAPVGL